ncbi:M57 family metalloprotease [Cystobacter fuscus]|uniref:M57 family metalloprotease n=1 Tax=Cystobacter fuscus TaxID=43 RepID=UPI0009DCD960
MHSHHAWCILLVTGGVYVGLDAHVTLEASREMLQPGRGSAEQDRTTEPPGAAVVGSKPHEVPRRLRSRRATAAIASPSQ